MARYKPLPSQWEEIYISATEVRAKTGLTRNDLEDLEEKGLRFRAEEGENCSEGEHWYPMCDLRQFIEYYANGATLKRGKR